MNRNVELSENDKFELYQEVLDACTNARAAVLGEEAKPN